LVEGLADTAGEDAVGVLNIDDVDIGTETDMGGGGTGTIVALRVEATELNCVGVCRQFDDAEAIGLDCCDICRETNDVAAAASLF
jgi:hypothetical protein